MTTKCKIGPVNLDTPYQVDGYDPGTDGSEKFTVQCSEEEAIQIAGLQSKVTTNKDGIRNFISGVGWGIVPVDASVDCKDNEDLFPRGYRVISKAAIDRTTNPLRPRVNLETEQIGNTLADILEMDYTTGLGDGTVLNSTYLDTVKNDLFYDDFTTFDQANLWDGPASSGMSSPSVTASGSKLVFSGAASTNGSWGSEWIKSTPTINGKSNLFTLEMDMEWVAKPASGHKQHRMYFWISSKASGSSVNFKGAVLLMLVVQSTGISYCAQVIKQDGTVVTVVPLTTTTAQVIKWKFEEITKGYFNLYVDVGSGYIKKVTHMWTDIQPDWSALYCMYGFWNMDSTSATMKTSFIEAYTYVDETPLNIVAVPGTPVTTPDFTRVGLEGTLNMYENPTGPLRFNNSIDNFYLGSVKGFNSNNTAGTANILTNIKDVLTPGKFYLHNGITKLEFTTNSVKVYGYKAGWQLIDEFVIGTINTLNALYVTSEKAIIQANTTKWTLERGRYFARAEHEDTDMTHNLKTCYYHDGITTSDPGANADITMATQNYVTAWNHGTGTCASPTPADDNRLMIIKEDPTTIKSDKIYASILTGIGWYDNTATGYNTASSIAKEFKTQTIQSIGLAKI